jgi:hypothetical protein
MRKLLIFLFCVFGFFVARDVLYAVLQSFPNPRGINYYLSQRLVDYFAILSLPLFVSLSQYRPRLSIIGLSLLHFLLMIFISLGGISHYILFLNFGIYVIALIILTVSSVAYRLAGDEVEPRYLTQIVGALLVFGTSIVPYSFLSTDFGLHSNTAHLNESNLRLIDLLGMAVFFVLSHIAMFLSVSLPLLWAAIFRSGLASLLTLVSWVVLSAITRHWSLQDIGEASGKGFGSTDIIVSLLVLGSIYFSQAIVFLPFRRPKRANDTTYWT